MCSVVQMQIKATEISVQFWSSNKRAQNIRVGSWSPYYYTGGPQRLMTDVSSRSRRTRACQWTQVTGQLQLGIEVGGLEN